MIEKSDHERVVTSGAWLGATLFLLLMCWADAHIPHLFAFALNWAVVLGVCYTMAVYKRRWYGWVAFWGMAAACATSAVLQLAGFMHGLLPTAGLLMACVICFTWYWLIRMPRWQPAVEAIERREVHVFHHVIHHGQAPGMVTATTSSGEVADQPQKVIPGSVIRAIEAPRKAASLITAARGAVSRRSTP
jgi:hypothetical protein